ncbi:MAG: kynureninase [Bacteroidales bacterium]
MELTYDKSYAVHCDLHDPLHSYRDRFHIAEDGLIYLDGNSLGRLPLATENAFQGLLQKQWGERLVRSWNEGWYHMSTRLGKKIAQLIGAHPEEVIVCDSVSVALYKLAYGALKLRPERTEILSDDMNFPSDLYVMQGLIRQFGDRHLLRLVKSTDGVSGNMTDLLRLVSTQTALVTLTHTAFKSGFVYDMERVTELAHMHGALVLWDLSHSVGAMPIRLKGAGVDLAVGCTYKYLNGGPAAPAFLFVRRELQEAMENPIQGWFGDENPFEFRLSYRPAAGIRKFLTSSPPVLAMATLEPAVDLILEAGLDKIREKSMAQTAYALALAREWLSGLDFRVGSPETADRRGGHICLKHAEAYRICRALTDPSVGGRAVIPDFREPNNIRLGMSSLYTSYEEIYMALDQIRAIVRQKLYKKYPQAKETVT